MPFDGFHEDRAQFKSLIDQARIMDEAPNLTSDLIGSYPGLAWLKRYDPSTRKYYMHLISEIYQSQMLGPKVIEYINKTDYDFWPEEVARGFYLNDEAARLAGRDGVWVEERFMNPLTGKEGIFMGCKWSFEHKGVVYVAGAGRGIFTNDYIN